MKHRHSLLISIAVIALTIALRVSANADGETALSWYAGANDTVRVSLLTKNSDYLFLPSSADYSALCLSAPVDTTLTGDEAGRSVFLPAQKKVTADLTQLFGEMLPGESYTLCLETAEGKSSVTVIKSDALSSMHIEIAGELEEVNKSKDKSVAFEGSYTIIDPDGTVFASGTIDKFNGRGNSSWVRSNNKQPYNLKLSQASELLPGSGRSKRWALVSENVSRHDSTGLSNKTAMQLYRELGGEYALDSANIDLYVNGEYRGMYMLSEKVGFSDGVINIPDTVYSDKNDTSITRIVRREGVLSQPKYWNNVPLKSDRLTIVKADNAEDDPAIAAGIQAYQYYSDSKISSQSGCLIEIDFRFYESDAWFVTRRGLAVVVREPECPGREELQKIACYVQRFEDALFSANGFNSGGDYYADLLDLDSQVKMYLLDSFICNRDAHRASTFYYAELDADGEYTKLKAGPAWDYNSVDMTAVHYFGNDIGTYSYYIIWMTQLASHGDFLYKLNTMNSELLLPAVDELLNGKFDAYIEELSASQSMNEILWANDYSNNAGLYAKALKERSDIWRNTLWTDDKLLGLSLSVSGDTLCVKTAGTAKDLTWYRLDETTHSLEELPDVSGTEYIPEEEGIYCVSASGQNIIYNARSAMFTTDYSPNGIPSFTIYPSFTAYSNPVDTRAPEQTEMTNDETDLQDSKTAPSEAPEENVSSELTENIGTAPGVTSEISEPEENNTHNGRISSVVVIVFVTAAGFLTAEILRRKRQTKKRPRHLQKH